MTDSPIVDQILRRLGSMTGVRSNIENIWQECFDYSFPVRGDNFYGQRSDATSSAAKRARLLDGTSTDAGRILAASLISGATPNNSRWFGMSSGQDTDEEKKWFDNCSEIIWTNIHASNYDAVGFECCLDMVPAGWFVLFIDSNRKMGGYAFEQWPIAECWIASSEPGGTADTIVRKYENTVEQVVNDFGIDAVSDRVRALYDGGKYDDKVCLIRAIYPRKNGKGGAKLSKNLPFASCTIEENGRNLLRESGFHECPFVAPRWVMVPGTPYAVGPMFDALPDVKELNDLVRLEKQNAEMAIAGTYVATDDGVLNAATVKVGPGRVIVANDVNSIKPLPTGGNFSLLFTEKQALQAAIRKTLMADQLGPVEGPQMTATEVRVRVALIRQLLGPIYGRLQAEWLQIMVARCFGIAYRAGILPPPPQSLANRNFTVTFISPQAKAQKLDDVTAVEQTLVGIGQLAQGSGDPTVWDNVDKDEATRIIADGLSAPAKLMRDAKIVAVLRENRAKEQQSIAAQQQQAALLQPAAEEMAKNLVTA